MDGASPWLGVNEARAVKEVQLPTIEVGDRDHASMEELADREEIERDGVVQVASW